MPRSGLRVGDLMVTALVTLKAKDTIRQADLEMRLARIRHLPVVDDERRVVGIVSNRDLLRAFGASLGRPVSVSSIMARDVRTVRPETPAYEAAALRMTHKIGALPVIGAGEQLVGIVTETDFLDVAYRVLRGEQSHASPEA